MRVSKLPGRNKLIEFEAYVRGLWELGKIKRPVHLSGGNEDELIQIFTEVKEGDYVFSTHRNHYHALLAGISTRSLLNKITIGVGGSMCVGSRTRNFFSSAIVSGTCAIATGVAYGIMRAEKTRRGVQRRVWCFIGDGATDEGHFYEAHRYAVGHDLPITFVVEDNDRSVTTDNETRWGRATPGRLFSNCEKIRYYRFNPTSPHVGSGKHVSF